MPIRAYIGLGSNLAHPRRQLAKAAVRLATTPGVRVLAVSPHYRTAPLGVGPQPDYVNAVVRIETTLAPRALLARMHAIERRQHRRRDPQTPRNEARTLDLDLLLYGAVRLHTRTLTLPHPRMHERAFVLRPLTDLDRAAAVPGHGLARVRLRGLRGQRVARTHRRALP